MSSLLLLKIGLLLGGIAVGLLGASRSAVARRLLRPIGPRSDASNMTRAELLESAKQFVVMAAVSSGLFLLAGWSLEGAVAPPEWLGAAVAFLAVVLLICAVGFAGRAISLAVRAYFRPRTPPDSDKPKPIEPQ